MNLTKNINILILLFLLSVFAEAQKLPPIENYSPKVYGAENQNWAISQSDEKFIYVANNQGLLEFDGAKWKLYPSPNNTIIRSVNVLDDKINSELLWSDEFNGSGAPDSTKWGYDIGTRSNGWGNGEFQYYTNRLENAKVENGFLIITAKAESYEGSNYTSSRLLTRGKFDFTYGRVEVKAKLPSGGGTWPAIWMLGANFSTVGWPACGEIDIMEHAGNRQGIVQSAMHTSSSSGNTVNKGSQTLSDVSTEFHVYTLEWSADEMIFSVDDVVHYRYNPATKNNDTWPYDADQFIILNVAMGGSFGGTIDPNFTQSSMVIDYVRIYQ